MKGILQGCSATFLLLESGDAIQDGLADQTIKRTMKVLKEELVLPEGVVQTDGRVTGGEMSTYEAVAKDPSNVLESGIPLSIDFNMVRMKNDMENKIFKSILGKTYRSDSGQEDEPCLFLFFGRGRFLGPLIGEDIALEQLGRALHYLCGACSCQVKSQNPGLDFLTNINWQSYLSGSEVIVDKVLPPLIGVTEFLPPDSEEDLSMDPAMGEFKQQRSSMLKTRIGFTIIAVLAVVAMASFFMRRRA
jgi:hypothetical protein